MGLQPVQFTTTRIHSC